ncbi:MAG: methyltransferase domain-containing protein [Anaerolineales bacterium]|nr:methyltransferase domain-containing protein [Anaerolineales bacterium]
MPKPIPPEILTLLRNPYHLEALALDAQADPPALVGVESGQTFPVISGIPSFLESTASSRHNRYYRWFYDRFAFGYDTVVRLGSRLRIGTETTVRAEAIATLPVKSGDFVLESAVGTGSNIPVLPPDINFCGVDISFNMLRRAQRKLPRWERSATFFHADAEYLPFQDNAFDLVFQMGGLQFMGDPASALAELLRVAKPGTTIIVLDEAASAARTLQRIPDFKAHTWDKVSALTALPEIVPVNASDPQANILPSGEFYQLQFKKRD